MLHVLFIIKTGKSTQHLNIVYSEHCWMFHIIWHMGRLNNCRSSSDDFAGQIQHEQRIVIAQMRQSFVVSDYVLRKGAHFNVQFWNYNDETYVRGQLTT